MLVVGVKLLLVSVDRVGLSKKQCVLETDVFLGCENKLDFGTFENEFYYIIGFPNVLTTLRNFITFQALRGQAWVKMMKKSKFFLLHI